LAAVLRGRSTLLVASTDLSHFYPLARARALDGVVIADVREFDERALLGHLENGTAEACGGGPAAVVMTALKRLGSARMDIVHYATSGDVTGDQMSVVGYLSAVAM
jgi:AmmeMemoRadiSam system protein B